MNSDPFMSRKVSFPFYIFLSLLLGYMGIIAVRSVWLKGEVVIALVASALFMVHIGLYWPNYLQANDRSGWWVFYYPAQTALMVGIVFLLNNHTSAGLSFLFSATLCLIGEALGVWGGPACG